MWQWILFLRDRVVQVTDMLNSFSFEIADISVSLLDLIIGFIIMGIVISVFWKGART